MKRTAMALALVLACIAQTVSAQSPKFGPQVSALVAEAAQEGRLDLAWSGSAFGDNGKGLPDWIGAFNKFYGLNLAYSFTPAPSMTQQAARLMQEAQSGTPAATDVIILGGDALIADIQVHATRSYDWMALAKDVGVALPPKAVAFSTGIFGLSYNKEAVSTAEMPKSLAEVLDPKWKGRVAATPYAAGFSFLAALDPAWGPEKTEAYVRKLAGQIGGLIRCGESAPLLSGQFDMLAMECDIASVISDRRRNGTPIDYVIAKDAPIVDLWYAAVPKTDKNPAAAALLILFLLTPEGQKLSWDWDGNDLFLLSGSQSAKIIPGAPDHIGFLATEQDFMAKPESLTYTDTYVKILQGAARR